MPSLHGAFSMLVAVTLWPLVANWAVWARIPARVVLASYPLLMCFSLVYTAEHYVVDILAGWLLVALVEVIARSWERQPWAAQTWPSRGFP
jgi:membrane-associated phospholipid phosphatase